MTPEQLDKARLDDARCYAEESDPAANDGQKLVKAFERYRHHVVSNWTPPAPTNPRVMAMREYLKIATILPGPDIDAGKVDYRFDAKAFLAGFAAAVKLAEPLVARFIYQTERPGLVDHVNREMITTYRQSIGDE